MLEFRMMVREMVEEEGRTVFISSHLLDEVEKMCDAGAIVDQGRILATGTIAELRADGAQRPTIISCEEPARALAIVEDRHPGLGAEALPDGLRLPTSERARIAAINHLLVTHDIAVWRVEPAAEHSLEERFLQLTSRLKDAA
jgi:ABC-2 type transport system ATP-binding protein